MQDSVMAQNVKHVDLIGSWGYSVKIALSGQGDKCANFLPLQDTYFSKLLRVAFACSSLSSLPYFYTHACTFTQWSSQT